MGVSTGRTQKRIAKEVVAELARPSTSPTKETAISQKREFSRRPSGDGTRLARWGPRAVELSRDWLPRPGTRSLLSALG